MSIRKKTVLVTHADETLGRETALWLGESGFRVLAGGKNPNAMLDIARETAPGGLIETIELDLGDNASCVRAVERMITLFGRLDALVCTGNRAHFGAVEETDDAEARLLFEENFFGPLRIIKMAAPQFRQQKSGVIVAISSAAGRIALPMSGPYSASRYALEGLCDTLRLELGMFNVNVVLLEPGLIRERLDSVGKYEPDVERIFHVQADSAYAPMANILTETYRQMLHKAASPQDVVKVIEKVLSQKRPKPRVTVTRGTAAILWARKLLPDRLLDSRLAKAMGLRERP